MADVSEAVRDDLSAIAADITEEFMERWSQKSTFLQGKLSGRLLSK